MSGRLALRTKTMSGAVRLSRTGTLDEALDYAGRYQGLAHHTADHAEAVASFFEKRPPVFKG